MLTRMWNTWNTLTVENATWHSHSRKQLYSILELNTFTTTRSHWASASQCTSFLIALHYNFIIICLIQKGVETGTSSRLLQGPSSALLVYLPAHSLAQSSCSVRVYRLYKRMDTSLAQPMYLWNYVFMKLEEANSEEMLSNPRVHE